MHDESSNHRNIRTRPGGRQSELASRPMRLPRPKYHRITGRPLCRSGACSLEDLYKLSLHPELERTRVLLAISAPHRECYEYEQVRDMAWNSQRTVIGAVVYLRSRVLPSGWQGPQATILSVARRRSNCRTSCWVSVAEFKVFGRGSLPDLVRPGSSRMSIRLEVWNAELGVQSPDLCQLALCVSKICPDARPDSHLAVSRDTCIHLGHRRRCGCLTTHGIH